ncbi:putative metal-binding hydrolase [Georgfuchsia toluolica]|uniref:Metal-binding hydrolase n=1 Tax=Georgfuchsia toluolica TaxID=424218 RepID=A0A916J4X9_9PROT|nr:MBL fold metallo-hydrolase [Georgfuchsia toluolica]CAG4884749.1 putative metal-binding hydrolase [Georgfuchsia toluolica]
MKYTIVPVTPFVQNCSIMVCDETQSAVVIDPGGDIEKIVGVASKAGLIIEKVLLTHGHIDHAAAAGELARRLGVKIEGPHEDDLFLLQALPQQAAAYGFPPVQPFVSDRWLHQGDTVSFGKQTLEVMHCPGHTPGHVIYFHRRGKFAVVGDVLFAGSIGRTDFPCGNHEDLIRSIREKLFPLGDDVEFIPGHGPNSTFGKERATNPYVADAQFL